MNLKIISLSVMTAVMAYSCSHNAKEVNATEKEDVAKEDIVKDVQLQAPAFPYESYFGQLSEYQTCVEIGDDGEGFNAISHKIRYPEVSAESGSSQFADSLLLLYNTSLAYNTMAYDVSTAERYIWDNSLCVEEANALDSINLSGIKDKDMREALLACSKKSAKWIREGNSPNEQKNSEVAAFYEVFNKFGNKFLDKHMTNDDFDPSTIIVNYDEIHQKAISDSSDCRDELLEMVLAEKDFQKKCVLAREFAYANFNSKEEDDMELVAVIDPILRSGEYSPLLYDLWLVWRTALQKDIFGSPSNDGSIYNLFYNDMRNRVALTYINYLERNPNDKVAFKKFAELAMQYNITRNALPIGNNSLLDEMNLYKESPRFAK